MRTLGVPYPEGYEDIASDDYMVQAKKIVDDMKNAGIESEPDTKIIALIAYLQRLGIDIKQKD